LARTLNDVGAPPNNAFPSLVSARANREAIKAEAAPAASISLLVITRYHIPAPKRKLNTWRFLPVLTVERAWMGDDANAREFRFEALVQRHSRFVFRVAYAVLRNPHAAEDVAQETFLKLFRNGRWEDIREERAFLARVAWRIAVDRIPRREREQELFDRTSVGDTLEASVIQSDAAATIHRLIDALPEDLRRVMALAGIEGMNSSEIAKTIGLPAGTVRTRLMRAREIVKQKLSALTLSAPKRSSSCGK
jgi:RNA polymerase sigma-70 factor (ECF subfamily)